MTPEPIDRAGELLDTAAAKTARALVLLRTVPPSSESPPVRATTYRVSHAAAPRARG